jgi:hypothetical protein
MVDVPFFGNPRLTSRMRNTHHERQDNRTGKIPRRTVLGLQMAADGCFKKEGLGNRPGGQDQDRAVLNIKEVQKKKNKWGSQDK